MLDTARQPRQGETRLDDSTQEAMHAAMHLASALKTLAGRDDSIKQSMVVLGRWLQDSALFTGTSTSFTPSSRGRFEDRRFEQREPIDVQRVIDRARLKSQVCQFILNPDAPDELEDEYVEKARQLPHCWLWMLHTDDEVPDELIENLGIVYEALARSLEVARKHLLEGSASPEDATVVYTHVAESQSALWAGLGRAGVTRDQDQIDTFVWLRERTRIERVYIERFMRREDPADPNDARDLLQRIETLDERMTEGLPASESGVAAGASDPAEGSTGDEGL
ncbi:MAG: hypothetical protein ACF8GE_00820 [Phycisphaerales bacterium JB043]